MKTYEEFKAYCYKWLNPVADEKYMKKSYSKYKREQETKTK